jgi:hypothetical protein
MVFVVSALFLAAAAAVARTGGSNLINVSMFDSRCRTMILTMIISELLLSLSLMLVLILVLMY